jgi:cytochrome c peroxidase
MRLAPALVLVSLGLAAAACGDAEPSGSNARWEWNLPAGFPEPRVPADNPMTPAKVELGRRLFYDVRLSGNMTQSCSSCHDPARAFTNGLAVPIGSTGESMRRNAMTLTNVAWNSVQTWANPDLHELEQQVLVPMLGGGPVELGLAGREDELLDRLRAEPIYRDLFPRAFPDEATPFTVVNVARAIASFERTIISTSSPYDRFKAGDENALSPRAKRGFELFTSERLECHHCHGGFNLTDSYEHMGMEEGGFRHYFNIGLYNIDGVGGVPASDIGLAEMTARPGDVGRYRAPTLRNIAVTAPYMHDGSIATLGEVIDVYARGGRLIADGPNKGDGATSPLKNALVSGFPLRAEEREELLLFLESLTDETLLSNPALADPWVPSDGRQAAAVDRPPAR